MMEPGNDSMNLRIHQEEALQKRFAASGRCADLLLFHAACGDWDRVAQLGNGVAQDHADDALVHAVLTLPHTPERGPAVLEQFSPVADPYLGYCLTKHFLAQSEVKGALTAVKTLVKQDKANTAALNLVAKYLAINGRHKDAIDVVHGSLRLSADQRDLTLFLGEMERGRRLPIDLYLNVTPRPAGISFYTPVYNGAPYLRETIEALLCQNYPLEEILVIDDGSSDETPEIARQYPVRLIRFPENRGLAAGRNAALREASSDFLGSVDGDVCPETGYTSNILAEFENALAPLAGVGGRLIERHTETPADHWRAVYLRQGWYPRRMYFDAPRGQEKDSDIIAAFFLNGCNNIFRRDYALAVGGYNEKYRTNSEDCSFCAKLRAAGYHLAFTRTAVTRHTRRDTIFSVLKTAWNYGFWCHQEGGIYGNVLEMLDHMGRRTNGFHIAMDSALAYGADDLAQVSFLALFVMPMLDVQFVRGEGRLTPEQEAVIQDAILQHVRRLDERFGGNLQANVERVCASLITTARVDRTSITAQMEAALHRFNAGFGSRMESVTAEAYWKLGATDNPFAGPSVPSS